MNDRLVMRVATATWFGDQVLLVTANRNEAALADSALRRVGANMKRARILTPATLSEARGFRADLVVVDEYARLRAAELGLSEALETIESEASS